MKTTQMPDTEHAAFDTICEQVEEFEPLPTVNSGVPQFASDSELDIDERHAPLDGLILAGLVSP